MKVQKSVVFVTGGNRGLGLAFAREALHRGAAKIYVGMRNTNGFDVPGLVPVSLDVTDLESVRAAAAACSDTTLLVNNAGIGRLGLPLDSTMEALSREVFETNYYGLVRTTQAFAPVLAKNNGGAIINVLSDVTWRPVPILSAYSASKAAAWSFTNTLRPLLKEQRTQVLALHVGVVDTDLTKDFNVPKSNPATVVRRTLDALEANMEEALADEGTQVLKQGLSRERASYLDPA
ncbi:SDR family oxidoreductase [Nevskia soli]|uniref:SDR family oxidoreductase n=1 Tax=Nevskia soli TaxID=418856 RepID=UPI0004A73345|nr:SDR family oxidoreductase [Nevskia soli]